MNPITFIRAHVLAISGQDLADVIGVHRVTVAKWESGINAAPIEKLRPILAAQAAARNLPWSDSWLFEVPMCNSCPALADCGSGCARIVAACGAIREGDRAAGLALLAGCGGCVVHGGVPLERAATAAPLGVEGCAATENCAAVAARSGAASLHERQMNGGGNGKDAGDFPLVSAACVLDQDARPETRGPSLAVFLGWFGA